LFHEFNNGPLKLIDAAYATIIVGARTHTSSGLWEDWTS